MSTRADIIRHRPAQPPDEGLLRKIEGCFMRPPLGTFYHQFHHRYYECNYGNQELPWNRWSGTFHDGSGAGACKTRARKKRMYAGG